MFDERNDGLRRPLGVQYIRAANLARVGHAFQVRQCADRFWLRETYFDASGAPGMRFQLARRAKSDHLAEVHDGDAIAKALGFFKVIDRKSTRLNSSHVATSYAVF